jgi:hypothetical protein
MLSSQAILGAFESAETIKINLDKELIQEMLNYVVDKDVSINETQWKKICSAIYESDLVADFMSDVITIAEQTLEGEI